MLNRSILIAIIGFLVGCLLYYVADAGVVIVLIMGCTGYFFGLILDNADIKHQLDTSHFSNIPSTQEIFQSDDVPEALLFYASKNNLTTVSIDFQVETKPQTFRLSVLKNLQEHQFRILEDSSKTIFSLTLDYPECNYPKILSSSDQNKEFHYNIQERSLDFQNAVQKIVPGLVLSTSSCPSLFEEKRIHNRLESSPPRSSQLPPPSFPSNNFVHPSNSSEITDLSENESKENRDINETQIMEDLFSGSSVEPMVPDLSPEDVQNLKDSNQRQLEVFLNENNESEESSDEKIAGSELESTAGIEIDYSKVTQPRGDSIKDFNQDIINRLEERTIIAINKGTPDLELQKEREEIKKYIDGEATTEESIS